VQASIRITLRNFKIPIRCNSDEIILPLGLHCKIASGQSLNTDGKETFWSTISPDSCRRYDILYEDQANKLTPKANQTSPTVYTTRKTTFTLKTAEISLWLVQIEHPKLFILKTQCNHAFKVRSRISMNNLDIFAYVNSKFVYVEKHKTQLMHLYRDIMEQKCALEKQIQNSCCPASSPTRWLTEL